MNKSLTDLLHTYERIFHIWQQIDSMLLQYDVSFANYDNINDLIYYDTNDMVYIPIHFKYEDYYDSLLLPKVCMDMTDDDLYNYIKNIKDNDPKLYHIMIGD